MHQLAVVIAEASAFGFALYFLAPYIFRLFFRVVFGFSWDKEC
jgi:hypothetical protein